VRDSKTRFLHADDEIKASFNAEMARLFGTASENAL
jgi:hypothetical protein